MSTLVIEHDSEGGIVSWRYEASDEYEPKKGEYVPDSAVDHRTLEQKRVDLSGETAKLVKKANYTPSETINRASISQESKNRFIDARDKLQTLRDEALQSSQTVEDNQMELSTLSGENEKLQAQINAEHARLDAIQKQIENTQKMLDDVYSILTGDRLE